MRKGDKIDDSLIGGNASAEGACEDEGTEDPSTTSGIDVVLDNRLRETGFGKKKDFQVYSKVDPIHWVMYSKFCNSKRRVT